MSLTIVTCDVGSGYTGILAGHDSAALVDFGADSRDMALQALTRAIAFLTPLSRFLLGP